MGLTQNNSGRWPNSQLPRGLLLPVEASGLILVELHGPVEASGLKLGHRNHGTLHSLGVRI